MQQPTKNTTAFYASDCDRHINNTVGLNIAYEHSSHHQICTAASVLPYYKFRKFTCYIDILCAKLETRWLKNWIKFCIKDYIYPEPEERQNIPTEARGYMSCAW